MMTVSKRRAAFSLQQKQEELAQRSFARQKKMRYDTLNGKVE